MPRYARESLSAATPVSLTTNWAVYCTVFVFARQDPIATEQPDWVDLGSNRAGTDIDGVWDALHCDCAIVVFRMARVICRDCFCHAFAAFVKNYAFERVDVFHLPAYMYDYA